MEYKTVCGNAKGGFVEKKSRFIGYIASAKTEDEALSFINKIKKENYNATHNVSAYILRESGIKRYSDDGEPQGTAGIPVLDVLEKEGIVDAVIVVTRYFGGILLGAGGLVRAYSKGAKTAIDAGEIVVMQSCDVYSVEMDYSFYGIALKIVEKFECKILSSDFAESVELRIMTVSDKSSDLLYEFKEQSSATVTPIHVESVFAQMHKVRNS